jgi:DNA methylase
VQLADLYPNLAAPISHTTRAPKGVGLPQVPLRGGKGTPVYLAHSYPTKVPPEAIQPLIEHFTRPGDVVCDPFSGSGMTGVSSLRAGRQVILNDLSPLAAHLGWNLTHACDARGLQRASDAILADCVHEMQEWYQTSCVDCGGEARLEWLLWGDTVRCPACGNPVRLWDAGFDREQGTMPASVTCPGCATHFAKRRAQFVESVPVWANVRCLHGCGRHERPPLDADIDRAMQHRVEPIGDWFPTIPVDATREMYIRSALHLRGISTVADFYTKRNLRALARIWARITVWPDDRERQALAFAFTNTAWHGTRMRRFNARGGQRPLTGTLYVPQMSVEVNVATVFRHKIAQLSRFYSNEPARTTEVSIRVGSATHLSHVESASVDYVFTDPPFGSNIFYADCNLIAESWLGDLTVTDQEAVVNRSLRPDAGGKTVVDYASLMEQAFSEIGRVLKLGAWATIVFQNTDLAVWAALHSAVEASGLVFGRAGTLDKTQQSHKGYKGRSGVEDVAAFDMVLNLRRHVGRRVMLRPPADRLVDAEAVLWTHLAQIPEIGASRESDRQRTLPYLYSVLLAAHFNGDIGLHSQGFDTVRVLCSRHFECDTCGRWSIPTRPRDLGHSESGDHVTVPLDDQT